MGHKFLVSHENNLLGFDQHSKKNEIKYQSIAHVVTVSTIALFHKYVCVCVRTCMSMFVLSYVQE